MSTLFDRRGFLYGVCKYTAHA